MKKKGFIILLNLFIGFQLYSNTSENVFNKVFVLGNSLTLGFGTHGMASTDINSDYYYWVQQALLVNNNNLSMSRLGGSTWETGNSDTRINFLNNTVSSYITGEEDLIIIQLGDNVGLDVRETLKEDAVVLINWFNSKCPNAEIIWVYGWYAIASNMPLIEEAIEENEICELVDISDYSYSAKYKSAIGNTYINRYGEIDTITLAWVATHPGDLGMEMIAYEIINKLEIDNNINTVDSFDLNSELSIISKQIFDLKGNRIESIIKNQLCIVKEIYSDGSAKIYKVFLITD
jgi:hypothetical protein